MAMPGRMEVTSPARRGRQGRRFLFYGIVAPYDMSHARAAAVDARWCVVGQQSHPRGRWHARTMGSFVNQYAFGPSVSTDHLPIENTTQYFGQMCEKLVWFA